MSANSLNFIILKNSNVNYTASQKTYNAGTLLHGQHQPQDSCQNNHKLRTKHIQQNIKHPSECKRKQQYTKWFHIKVHVC